VALRKSGDLGAARHAAVGVHQLAQDAGGPAARELGEIAREGSGIVCLCIRPDQAGALKLRPMVERNRSRYATAFTQSIEAAFGVSTGVSAADRVQTIQCALRSTLERSEIVSPGHVFPLVAREGGVLERQGHTEAAVDLAWPTAGGESHPALKTSPS
jgi:3,4-dihydroxy 2-butanone 4-phosphate synthase